MTRERFEFPNARGQRLAAVLDLPAGEATAYALFAHCFTCGKDNLAAARIARSLVERGLAVLRFDFTGLGSSDGEFANTGFSSNIADLLAAAAHLAKVRRPPAILIGHSLGGAAVLAAAHDLPETRAVVTIAAPSDPAHVTGLFNDRIEAIRAQGEGEVLIAGRPFRVRREFLDDVAEQHLLDRIAVLRKPLLVLHSPTDEIVEVDNGTMIFSTAQHPKSFVALPGADHLLSRRGDAAYAAGVIATWAERYVDSPAIVDASADPAPGTVVVRETGRGRFQQEVAAGSHRLFADEPVAVGGLDSGPGPYDLVLAALGACTSMTLRMYAQRKALPLERVVVTLSHGKVHAQDCETCETQEGMIDRIERTISLTGALDAAQRNRLREIADKCPVHRTLTSEIDIRTVLEEQAT
jgi:uncharacterized OsmC-like protein/alpha-beta hydrolase superfamily lysophospholipase